MYIHMHVCMYVAQVLAMAERTRHVMAERTWRFFGHLHHRVVNEQDRGVKTLFSILDQLAVMGPAELDFCIDSYEHACMIRSQHTPPLEAERPYQ